MAFRIVRLSAVAWLAVAVFVPLADAGSASAGAPQLSVRVDGQHLVDGTGHAVRLLGVNRSGSEYLCLHAGAQNVFDGPTSTSSIDAMKSWHVNTVRLPLNETCWLGINGVPAADAQSYRDAIASYVQQLHRAGLYAVLDLHWAAPGELPAIGMIPLPDADHAPDFWSSVATRFRSDHAVLFDLYNEPYGTGWWCWRAGCLLPAGGQGPTSHPAYRTAGMQQLVDAVRATGATQPIMVGGLDSAHNLDGWLTHHPHDPAHQLVASEHNYGLLAPCADECQQAITAVADKVPVVVGELGETDCAHDYIDAWMGYADRHGISYLGWTWNATAAGGWTCSGGPSLIKDWAGTPTNFGVGFKRHLRVVAAWQSALSVLE